MKAHRRRGFTLVELMITIAVIGILGLVVTPGILTYIPQYRVNRAAKALATEMNLTRMRAIAKNRIYYVVFAAGSDQTVKVYEESTNDTSWSTSDTLVKTIALATEFPNVRLDYNSVTGLGGTSLTSAVTFPNDRAVFLPNGLLSTPGAFYLMPAVDKNVRNDRMRAVEVGRAGQVTLYRYDTATSGWEEM